MGIGCDEINLETTNTKANKAWRMIKVFRKQHKDTAGMNFIPLKDCCEKFLTENRSEPMNDCKGQSNVPI